MKVALLRILIGKRNKGESIMALMEMPTHVGGGDTPFDNWPDLSNGETITAFVPSGGSARITNITKNKAKKIGTDVYIELAGNLNVNTATTAYNSWSITNAISAITNTSTSTMDMWADCDVYTTSSISFRGFFIDGFKAIAITTYGAKNYTSAFDLKIILHNQ